MILIQTKGITKSIDLFNLEIESSRGWRLVDILQDTVPVMKSEQTNTNGYMGTQLVPTGSSQTITRAIVEKDEDSAIAALTKRVEDTIAALTKRVEDTEAALGAESAKLQKTDKALADSQLESDKRQLRITSLSEELTTVRDRVRKGADALSAAEAKLARLREQLGKKQYDEALGDLAEKKS